MSDYEKIADFLQSIGWRSICDAQWERLRDALPDLREMLSVQQASSPSGGEVCIGEVRENGVVWFGQNPHAHPIGTRFYTSPRVVDADMLNRACVAYNRTDGIDNEWANEDAMLAALQAALEQT